MLRIPVAATLSLGLAALLAAPLAVAQDDDGCTNREPCPLIVDVDENGLYLVNSVLYGQPGQPTHLDLSLGDWYQLTVDSMDPEKSHTVSLSGHDVSVTVGPDSSSPFDANAFELKTLGTYKLRDQPSGDEFEIRVVEGDALSSTSGPDSDSQTSEEGTPGLAPLAVLAAIVGAAALRRR